MYAIVEIAGQQFKVVKDQKLFVHRLQDKEGSKVSFGKVYLLDDGKNVTIGAPSITGASVQAKVVGHLKGDKVIVFKKKRRKGYRVKNGHRQALSELLVENIVVSGPKSTSKSNVEKVAPVKIAEQKKATVNVAVKKAPSKKATSDDYSKMTVAELKVAAKEKGITVTNTPDVLTDATADIQILLLLGASRKAYEGRLAAETQNWKWSWDFLLGKQMSNKKLGILGMGRIGRAVAKRAKAFNMEIHYHNRSKLSPELEDGAIYHKDLKSLFKQSEFLSINCPATPETTKLVNKETLNYLEENTVVGNAARGDIVDDDAMIEALKSGKVFAYGLDVYNGEPKIHPEYLKLKNIFLLPHLGSATKRTRWDMAFRATKNLEDFFSGRKPQDQVN